MSQQGWSRGPHSGQQDDWWSQLYDPGSPDTGRGRSGDTLDDRYASVRRTVGPATAPGGTGTGRPARPDKREAGDGGPETSGPEPGREAEWGRDGEFGPEPEFGWEAEPETEAEFDAKGEAEAEPGREAEPGPEPGAGTESESVARSEGERDAGLADRSAGPATRPAGPPSEEPPPDPRTSRSRSPYAPPAEDPRQDPAGPSPADVSPLAASPFTTADSPPTVAESPAFDPPAFDPPAFDPPAFDPPAFDPPAFDPPAFDPPASDPPASDPLASDRPATDRVPADATAGRSGAPAGEEVSHEDGGSGQTGPGAALRPDHVGDRPPTYEAEPATFPAADPSSLSELVPDTVLDGAHYGGVTLRAASIRGDSARHRGALRRDALLTARFGAGESALLLVAVAAGGRAATGGHRAAREICHSIGGVVGRSHARLAEDIRADRRAELKSGLQRLTDRCYGKLRAQAAAWDMQPEEYTADLRCLLLSADPRCRTRVVFGAGAGGLFLLRSGTWREIEPGARPGDGGRPLQGAGPGADSALDALDPSELGDLAALSVPTGANRQHRANRQQGTPGSGPPGRTGVDPRTMAVSAAAAASTPSQPPLPQPARPEREPFRFCATAARRGDTLLLCSPGLAEPLRSEPPFARRLARAWSESDEPPGLAAFLADVQLRVRGYADDRTAVAVWEA